MSSRAAAALNLGVLALAGAVLGVVGLKGLADFLDGRALAWRNLPQPRSTLWLDSAAAYSRTLDWLDRPLVAVLMLLVLLALALLGRTLDETLTLRKTGPGTGEGIGLHIDLGLLPRAALAVVASLWLLGAAAAAGLWLPGPAGFLLAGPIAWVASLPPYLGAVVHGLLIVPPLWVIWGPGGFCTRTCGLDRRWTLLWSVLAAVAASPFLLLLVRAGYWVAQVSEGTSLAQSGEWQRLMRWTVILPTAGCVGLAAVAAVYRPRPVAPSGLLLPALVAVLLAVGALAVERRAAGMLAAVDAGVPGLGPRLGLRPSPLPRHALILSPDGSVRMSGTTDGTDAGRGEDPIACNGHTVQAVEQFLQGNGYRSRLAPRAISHLHDCASLDWLTTRAIELNLEALRRYPDPRAARLLLERFVDVPITPRHRELLGQFADPREFRWPTEVRARVLGGAYVRFGDVKTAAALLDGGGLSRRERGMLLSGPPMLTRGVLRGRILVRGRPVKLIRVGLARADNWGPMEGICRSFEWRRVLAAEHTDENGNFEFRNLGAGNYVLVITGDGIGRLPGIPTAVPHPRAIEIDNPRPVRTLPTIDLRWIPAPLPAERDPADSTARATPPSPHSSRT